MFYVCGIFELICLLFSDRFSYSTKLFLDNNYEIISYASFCYLGFILSVFFACKWREKSIKFFASITFYIFFGLSGERRSICEVGSANLPIDCLGADLG